MSESNADEMRHKVMRKNHVCQKIKWQGLVEAQKEMRVARARRISQLEVCVCVRARARAYC